MIKIFEGSTVEVQTQFREWENICDKKGLPIQIIGIYQSVMTEDHGHEPGDGPMYTDKLILTVIYIQVSNLKLK